MSRVSLILALHNHQPVGNFDDVIDHCARRAYLPTLDTWREFPELPLALHNSGSLWEWLENFRPEYMESVAALVERDQVELLTGGFHEPILPAIPDDDKVGQVRRHRAWLKDRFGVDARTLWLTERVWEPGLPRPLAEAGVRAAFVDDQHFHAAGVPHRELAGHFRTEEAGQPLDLFPILKELRYLVPFHAPHETIDFLRGWAEGPGERLAVLGDDGEKFGVWPETFKLVHEDGWLRRFLELLRENRDWIDVTTPARWLERARPRGLVYLPTASYSEMMEWALPSPAQAAFEHARAGAAPDAADAVFLRGGFWRNFLSKYDESNRMHKRALDLSRRVREMPEELRAAAREPLWRAQCNCAYWHGVFGGLYLPHLRDAVYRNLVDCETELARSRNVSLYARELELMNAEGQAWILRNDHVALVISPERGGTLIEWDDLRTRHNLGNTLTRRHETYHDRLAQAVQPGDSAGDGAASIHDRVRAKEPGLEALVAADRHPRVSFLDHWLDPALTPQAFHDGAYPAWSELPEARGEAALEWDRGCVFLTIARICDIRPPGASEPTRVKVLKRYGLLEDEPGFEVRYTLQHQGGPALSARFAVEWNVTLLTGDSPDRWMDLGDGEGRRRMNEVAAARLVSLPSLGDEWLDLGVESDVEPRADAWSFPVETVSLSEDGFERNYQGTCLLFHWLLDLQPGPPLTLRFEPRHGRAPAVPPVGSPARPPAAELEDSP